MTDWIDKKAEQERQQREPSKKRAEWKLREETEVRARGPELLLKLEDIVRSDVSEWNKVFKDQHRQIEEVQHTGNGFRVQTSSSPCVSAQVSFDPEALKITGEIVIEGVGGERPIKGFFPMKLSKEGDAIYLTSSSSSGEHLSLKNVSQILIEALDKPDNGFKHFRY